MARRIFQCAECGHFVSDSEALYILGEAVPTCPHCHTTDMLFEQPECVVVTRHPALVEYLVEQGLIPAGAQVITHATPADVRGRDVIGVLPLSLAALAQTVTEVPLNLPAELRGQELSLAQVRQYAGAPVIYEVNRLD